MIKLRIDVDYPYPSRTKSFLHIVLNKKISNNYLKNSKIIAKMINESTREVRAYWFFTFKTMPDRELLELLALDKHEAALHIVNNPYAELKLLERATKRKINYYTIHGTARLLARAIWRRKPWEDETQIPSDFPLKSFHDFPTVGLDALCYANSKMQVEKMAENSIIRGEILLIHPVWLFQRGKINHRGPFYDTLRKILRADKEFETVAIRKKGFARIAYDTREYETDIVPTDEFIEKIVDREIDIFTFIERKWCYTIPAPSDYWVRANDNIALLQVATYDYWWKNIGKKTRNMVRKAEKSGIKTEIVEPNEKLAEGIWKIYNETPIRQGRAFPHYGISAHTVSQTTFSAKNSTFLGAFLKDELAGFIRLDHGNEITIISQILSLQEHFDKAVNNALIARAVEVCANKKSGWLMYGRMGNHPSLDKFKQSNSFTRFPLTRYYVPLSKKGQIAVKMGLHREMKDILPRPIKYPLIPVYNWISRNKMRIKLRLAS